MTDFYDALETRSADARATAQFAALTRQVAHAKAHAPAYQGLLADINPDDVRDPAGLSRLPVTRKANLPALQRTAPPFAGFTAVAPSGLRRIFASPGPIYDAEGQGPDYWGSARALWALGLRRGDIVQNCFSYHFTPAGVMFEEGATAIGCPVIPAGVGNTELQARTIADVRPRAYLGTPDFLKLIAEKGDTLGLDLSSITLAHVTGGPLFPALRSGYADRGVTCLQSYGTADLGVIAYESLAREGLILNETVMVEIVRPGTGDPLPLGEVGEVVVTGLSSVYPLIRFATGDLSAMMPGQSPCGRTGPRIKGWMGRADQTTKVKGMFVHPAQVAEVLGRFPAAFKARLTVREEGGLDIMVLAVESQERDPGLADAIARTLQDVTKLRGAVQLVAPGSLPNDGKVIDDARATG